MLAQPTAAPTVPAMIVMSTVKGPKAREAPINKLLLERQDEKMDEVPLTRDKLALLDNLDPIFLSGKKK
ncbi:hypothetical protein C0992_008023, partial [Termitomyces sp. T32_za158]